MINRKIIPKIYLANANTDMRKSINGLTSIIQECFSLDLFSQSLFVFCNKARNKIKIIQWENNAFWLHYKRLEKGFFKWPNNKSKEPYEISSRELYWLLDGLSIIQKDAHEELNYKVVV